MKSCDDILNELRGHGFCILEEYWSEDKCNEALEEIKGMAGEHLEVGQGGDLRCGRADNHTNTAREFLNDSFIQEIANEYSSCSRAERCQLGIVEHKHDKVIDSGGGWHIDSEQQTQFKSFIYLTDVDIKNGPFVFIRKSNIMAKEVPKYSNLRISQETIDEKFNPYDIIEITGKAGTCILADTTHVHRGMEIKNGIRYTYTTYFYDKK